METRPEAQADARAALLRRARAWRDDDPDPETRAELDALIEAEDIEALQASFGPALSFGTAGIRGVIGVGPGRMNLRTVARTTAGLCEHLLASIDDAGARGLCIGYDGRTGSEAFAHEAAAVALGAGLRVHLFEGVVPTPALAFAVLELGAAGGVMVTASHNPAEYNGYKVYGAAGAQIVSPQDVAIADAIARCQAVCALPRVELATARSDGRLSSLGEDFLLRYLDALPGGAAPVELGIAYTALHGVGQPLALRALARAGFGRVWTVDSQARPDPTFPTVAFPNPEEAGAMDRVLQLADDHDADLVLANDPDADRLAAAARDRHGAMRALSGDQLGVLLAEHVLANTRADVRAVVLRSIVSSTLLDAVAAHHGAEAYATLTGFKWIYARAQELEDGGATMVFGFEEALGYGFGRPTRDKDGIHAAVVVAQLAAECAAAGQTLWGRLEALHARHGHHLTAQHSARYPGLDGRARIDAVMARLRGAAPKKVGSFVVDGWTDLLRGGTLPPSDLVIVSLQGGHRVCIRPSGTEPKVKVYLECVSPLPGQRGADAAAATMDSLRSATLTLLGLGD